MFGQLISPSVIKSTYQIPSNFLKRDVEIEIFYPSDLMGNEKLNLLLVNDGQDLDLMDFEKILEELYSKWTIEPVVVVGIKASAERIQEYGVAGRPDFKKRGSKADAHTKFITKELLPFVEQEVKMPLNGVKAYAGFSLGGISAFDVCWNNSSIFDKVGVFSGSFWWRKKDLTDGYTDNDRICHEMIRQTKSKPELKFWLMTGTNDEAADRNRNFIIDSIDDTIDIIKELMKKGYNRAEDIAYYERVGGKHDIDTWGKAMPAFLTWAFGR